MTTVEATLRRQVEDLTAEVESLRYTLTEVTAAPPDFAEQMEVCRLTKSQAAILSLIIKAGGRTVSHQSLVATLDWLLHRTEDEGTVETIKTQMCHLRQRLAKAGSPIRIRTVWGVGYALETAQ